MAADTARIEELRRRVQKDPASIAFAQLAEEYRRIGEYQEAVRVCRAGLEHHPAYLLAHVTLGRALMGLEQYPEAGTEFEYVLRVAPDNLIALKGMEALQGRAGVDLATQGARAAETPPNVHPYTEDDASPGTDVPLGASPPETVDPALEELEGWLARIQTDRDERARAGGSVDRLDVDEASGV